MAGRENVVGKYNVFDVFIECDNTAAASDDDDDMLVPDVFTTPPQFKFNRSALTTRLLARPAAWPASWRVACKQRAAAVADNSVVAHSRYRRWSGHAALTSSSNID